MTRKHLAPRCVVLAALCLGLALPATATAQKGGFGGGANGVEIRTSRKFLAAFRDAVAKPAQSTVRVQCDGKDAALGVVVTADGFILTASSELEGKLSVKLRDGKSFDAKLVGVHEPNGLAMLKIDASGLTPAKWTDSKAAPVGNWVASAGTGEVPVSVGVVGVASRHIAKYRPAPPPPSADSGFLGIGLNDGDGGALVGEVQPRTAAAKAGLKVNDIVLAVNNKLTPDAEALIRFVGRHKPGETITLKVRRGEDELEIKATLGKRPPGGNRGDFQNNMGSKLSKRRSFQDFLQHDTVILPTDCGGPLVDLDGHVIGINVARAGRTESYAIPSEAVRPLLEDLMSGRLAPKAAEK
jgi:serine protease Do